MRRSNRRRAQHPEVAGFLSIWLLAVILALSVLGTGGAGSPLLPTLTVPTLMLAARFRPTVVVVGVVAALLLSTSVLVGALFLPPAPPSPSPSVVDVATYLALLASLVAVAVTLQSADVADLRSAAVRPWPDRRPSVV